MRDVMEKGVAEAVTFPWGSVPLLGVDKVTKYHMDAPLHDRDVPVADEPEDLRRHVGGAEEGDRRSLHDRMGRQVRRPVGRLRARRPREGEGAARATRSIRSPPTQLAEWKKSAEPLHKQWADAVRKAGGDPDTIMKELNAALAQYKAGILTAREVMRDRGERSSNGSGGEISPPLCSCRRATAKRGRAPAEPRRMTQPDQPDRGRRRAVPLDVALGADLLTRNPMDRFIAAIELIAAFFVGLVAADTFVSVLLRYFFSVSDSRQPTISAGCCSAS